MPGSAPPGPPGPPGSGPRGPLPDRGAAAAPFSLTERGRLTTGTRSPQHERGRPAARALGACGAVLLAAACGASEPPARPAAALGSPSGAPTRPAPVAASTPDRPSPAHAPPRGTPPAPAATHRAATARPAETDPPLPSGLPSSAPLRVVLGAKCLAPGAEQRLVVESLPHAFVAFDNLYPDRRTGRDHGGAEAGGRTDGDGRFTATWRVAPGTPLGRVRVDVGVSARSGSAITMAYYRLAERCP